MPHNLTLLTGTVFDEEMICSLRDLCRLCNVSAETIHEMIDEGLLRPRGSGPRQWCFTAIEIRRTQTALRLQRDLRVNLPGCALVMDLLEELEELRRLNRCR